MGNVDWALSTAADCVKRSSLWPLAYIVLSAPHVEYTHISFLYRRTQLLIASSLIVREYIYDWTLAAVITKNDRDHIQAKFLTKETALK